MSRLTIHYPHSLSLEHAHQAVEQLAAKLAQRHPIRVHWQEQRLCFDHAGIQGQLQLEPGLVLIDARLAFWMAPWQPRLEQEIRACLAETFQADLPS